MAVCLAFRAQVCIVSRPNYIQQCTVCSSLVADLSRMLRYVASWRGCHHDGLIGLWFITARRYDVAVYAIWPGLCPSVCPSVCPGPCRVRVKELRPPKILEHFKYKSVLLKLLKDRGFFLPIWYQVINRACRFSNGTGETAHCAKQRAL